MPKILAAQTSWTHAGCGYKSSYLTLSEAGPVRSAVITSLTTAFGAKGAKYEHSLACDHSQTSTPSRVEHVLHSLLQMWSFHAFANS